MKMESSRFVPLEMLRSCCASVPEASNTTKPDVRGREKRHCSTLARQKNALDTPHVLVQKAARD